MQRLKKYKETQRGQELRREEWRREEMQGERDVKRKGRQEKELTRKRGDKIKRSRSRKRW